MTNHIKLEKGSVLIHKLENMTCGATCAGVRVLYSAVGPQGIL